jgi:tRNA A-37 threonylcarbamoyl transferase component Bud32
MITIKPLNNDELGRMTADAELVESDQYGAKVLRLADGRFLKFFRRKRLFNRELLTPAALTFARHARRLHELQIPTLQVLGVHRLVGADYTVAVYEPLPGQSLRQLLVEGAVDGDLMYRVGVFIARLHRLGVFFRSLHPGNIIINAGRIGLIDLLDMRLSPWSLSRWARRRNWQHFLRRSADRRYLTAELIDELLLGYRDAADLPEKEMQLVFGRVRSKLS